jgi:3-hydroxyacyl-[acyl-carrier-protein] dehydratase
MLLDSFFNIQSYTFENSGETQQHIHGVLNLNAGHAIYQGHFPGNPVVPGVCQVQMVKELVEKALGRRLILSTSDNIKFLSMISPRVNPQLEFDILIRPVTDQLFSATASIGYGSSVFLKFKGKFESSE